MRSSSGERPDSRGGGPDAGKTRRWPRSPHMLDRRVIDLLSASDRPLSVAELVKASEAGGRLGPTQFHRVIGRLIASGEIRRVELLRAYRLAGPAPGRTLAICSRCRSATELATPDFHATLNRLCEAKGFIVARIVCEIAVCCANCRKG